MIKIWMTNDGKLVPSESLVPGAWVHVNSPTEDDLKWLAAHAISVDDIHDALDEEEISRISITNDHALLLIDIPILPQMNPDALHSTIPMGWFLYPDFIVSVCAKDNTLFHDLEKVPTLNTANKHRTLLQFLEKSALKYLAFIKEIARKIDAIEERAFKSISNQEIKELMKLQKSLVILTTSLKTSETILERIKTNKLLKLTDDDAALMDDVLIEYRQAREMAEIHERILSNTMDNYGSIIANNLNDIMKILTSLTLLLSIPMIIFGLYGMNVGSLWFAQNPYFAIVVSVLLMLLTAVYFIRRRML